MPAASKRTEGRGADTEPSLAGRLADLSDRENRVVREHAALQRQFENELHDGKQLGYAEALARADQLAQRSTPWRPSWRRSGRRRAELQPKADAEHRRAEREADRRRVHSIPGLYRACAENAEQATSLAAQLGQVLGRQVALERELAAAVGTTNAQRAMSLGAIDGRVRHSMARQFEVTVDEPGKFMEVRGWRSPPHRFFIPNGQINPAHPDAKRSFGEAERKMLRDTVDTFDDRDEAEAARRKRDPTGENLHILAGRDGLLCLVPGRRQAGEKSITKGGERAMKTRVTPELAKLLARDIVASGGPEPKFRDRWSRAEAEAIEKWMRTIPWGRRAIEGRESGAYARWHSTSSSISSAASRRREGRAGRVAESRPSFRKSREPIRSPARRRRPAGVSRLCRGGARLPPGHARSEASAARRAGGPDARVAQDRSSSAGHRGSRVRDQPGDGRGRAEHEDGA